MACCDPALIAFRVDFPTGTEIIEVQPEYIRYYEITDPERVVVMPPLEEIIATSQTASQRGES